MITKLTRETFLAMREQGLTYAEIGNPVGWNKNQVSGWVSRNGLSNRANSPIKPNPLKVKTKTRKQRGVEDVPVVKYRGGTPASFKTCQWIEGEPTADEKCKCGKPALEGKPYCEPHQERSWTKT